jgi:hypothetical protein
MGCTLSSKPHHNHCLRLTLLFMLDRWHYIQSTLGQRGISSSLARFRQATIPARASRLDLPCYNEILFLLNAEQLPPGTRFFSDQNMFDVPAQYSADSMEEFSGLLTVTLPQSLSHPLTIEFLQIFR